MKYAMALKPHMSEKAYDASVSLRCYVFNVPGSASKLEVQRAVESQFGVVVTNVRVLNKKGKVKQSYRKRTRPVSGSRSDTKKAYVTLKEGDAIPVFAAHEEAEAKTREVQKQAAKAASKKEKS